MILLHLLELQIKDQAVVQLCVCVCLWMSKPPNVVKSGQKEKNKHYLTPLE